MFRAGLLYLSEHPRVFRFVRGNGLARRFASRFVAGESLETAAAAVHELNGKDIAASLDLLGESVTSEDEARAAASDILEIVERISADGLRCNVSLKLTQLGFDLSEALAVDNLRTILDRAGRLGVFVRIDMESSAYTERTLELFERVLQPAYGEGVGVVLQSYLRRTAADTERLMAGRARIRLCKGAYKEPPAVAFPNKADVDLMFAQTMERLIEHGNYPGIATHDEALITRARRFVEAREIPRERFEFQMLYGVRRDLQEALVRDGYRMRVYVPFGTQWYPYLMRRLAERPANLAFILGNVMREALR